MLLHAEKQRMVTSAAIKVAPIGKRNIKTIAEVIKMSWKKVRVAASELVMPKRRARYIAIKTRVAMIAIKEFTISSFEALGVTIPPFATASGEFVKPSSAIKLS